MTAGTRKPPPKKLDGQAKKPRRFTGELLDVKAVAVLLGVEEKCVRARVTRHQLPFRRLGGRIVFRRSELLDFLDKLEGVGVGEALTNATRAAAP